MLETNKPNVRLYNKRTKAVLYKLVEIKGTFREIESAAFSSDDIVQMNKWLAEQKIEYPNLIIRES